jgi:hypothetical protein
VRCFRSSELSHSTLFYYLDPDYAGRDTQHYPWLSAGGRDPSKPMG